MPRRGGRLDFDTPTNLSSDATRDPSGALTTLLTDMFALYVKIKIFYWHVSGPHFATTTCCSTKVLALSNPTEHAKCTPEQAYCWSKGKAIYAVGVQFPPVHLNGQTFLPGQANNFYIFPAVGMAIFATQAKRVTDDMFIESAKAVAGQVPPDLLKQGLL
jgi:hypothetical protein